MERTQRTEGHVSGRFGIALAVMAGILLAAVMLFAPGTARADEPFEIQFDKSDMKIGAIGNLLGNGSLPLDNVAAGGSIKGTIAADGTVTIPKGAFTMPELGLDNPVKIRLFMGVDAPATGHFDRATGQLDLDTKAGVWAQVDVGALLDLAGVSLGDLNLGGIGGIGGMIKPLLSDLTCGFAPTNVHFTTESTSLSSGVRFADGPAGNGAITVEFSKLGAFAGRTKLLGMIDACQLLRSYLPSLIQGGLGGALPGGIDLGGLDLAGLLANLDNVDLGPSSITLSRTVAVAKPPRLKITAVPVSRTVKPRQRPGYRITVSNVGGKDARNSRVCVSGQTVRGACSALGVIPAGEAKSRVVRVQVKAHRLGNGKRPVVRPLFTASAAGAGQVTTRRASVRVLRY